MSHVDQNYGRGGSKRWHNWFNQMAVIIKFRSNILGIYLYTIIKEYIYDYNNEQIKEKMAGMSPVEYRLYTSQLSA